MMRNVFRHTLHKRYGSLLRSSQTRYFSLFDAPHLSKCEANYAQLSPLSSYERTVLVHSTALSYVYGETSMTWGEMHKRVVKFASALVTRGIKKNDVVSIVCPNTPPMFEAHFAVPGTGAVLHTINTRLDAATVAYQLKHCEAKICFVDSEHTELMKNVIELLQDPTAVTIPGSENQHYPMPQFINIIDSQFGPAAPNDMVGDMDYETFIETGDADFKLLPCEDEWDAISVNYTSGTTGNPKGVILHYRGAYLNSVGNVLEWNMPSFAKYLWIQPMFHCNGWTFPWTLAKCAGCSFLLRYVRAEMIFDLLDRYKIDHMCGAPITMNTMLQYPERFKFKHHIKMWTAGAPPPPPVIDRFVKETGISVQTVYGLTETYGPMTTHLPDPEWIVKENLSDEELLARCTLQSRDALVQDVQILDPETMQPVPADGETLGEVMIKGNTVMKGYLKNPTATNEAFEDGWFHTGDLAVQFPNGRFQLKDRSKDIIISGGENISSIEVENIITSHPLVSEVAVIGMPHPKWEEVPCAFVTLMPQSDDPAEQQQQQPQQAQLTEKELIEWCRTKMARFQAPKKVIFGDLPKTSTGKVQKTELRSLLPKDSFS